MVVVNLQVGMMRMMMKDCSCEGDENGSESGD